MSCCAISGDVSTLPGSLLNHFRPVRGARIRTAFTLNSAGKPLVRTLAFAIQLLFSLGRQPALAQEASIVEARLTWFGVYQAGRDSVIEDKNTFNGTRIVSTGIEPPTTNSDRTPAILHSRFGFGFMLSGRPPGALVRLRFTRNFPAAGILSTKTGDRHFSEQSEFTVGLGQEDLFVGYSFEDNDELVPGLWSLEIWRGDVKLLEKSFTVYRP